MDLARVYVGPLNEVSMLVPASWDRWTFQGIKFERDGDEVLQMHVGLWFESKVEATRLDVRYSK